MKISELIKELQWQLDTYGEAEVRIDWTRHHQKKLIKEEDMCIVRVIGNYEMLKKLKKKLKNLNQTKILMGCGYVIGHIKKKQ